MAPLAIPLIRLTNAKSPGNTATVGRNHHADEWGSGYQEACSFMDQAEPIICWYLSRQRVPTGPAASSKTRTVMAAKTRFRGSFTALVTPFKNGSVDEKAFRELVDWQITEGTNGLVPVGTTSQSPTLSPTRSTSRSSNGVWSRPRAGFLWSRAPARTPPPRRSSLSKHAEKAGADAVLVVTPYYNKPTQEGLYQHFKAMNDAIGIPIIMYNIPARSIVDINVDTMKRLYELKNIAGVKDATANMARVSQQRMAMGEDFNQLSGEDITALGFNAHGGHGCISVTSNVAPRLCSEFQAACLKGDYATALKLQDKLAPLHINLFVETSPAPIKYAMSLIGKCDNTLRLPMVPASEKAQAAVREAMVHAGLIN